MIGSISDAIAKIALLNSAIESALAIEVSDEAKECVAQSAAMNVYAVYTPIYLYSRRGGNDGLSAESNIECTPNGNELTVRNVTDLQNRYGGGWSASLTNIVESGDYSFHMHLAGPRPFMEDAKELLLGPNGQAALRRGLARQGIILDGGA